MRPETHCLTTPEATIRRISSGEYPAAYMPAMIEPIEVPDT
jgi:hypothetical protein